MAAVAEAAVDVVICCTAVLPTCTGLAPAATIFMPSAMMAADRMVAVVVPSPAVSLVFAAACTGIQLTDEPNELHRAGQLETF